ncbi:DUF6580 family putative transport protein, partial [Pedobacter sp.]|uniref:DUF6580 family putative transport protein n=1 Tax=Pedobacter sp. TaxID=1411316 RepID=UPI003D7F6D7F
FSRALPHFPNFSPVAAIGLFGAAFFSRKWQMLLIPIAATWLSDLLLNNTVYAAYYPSFTWFYPGFYWQYGSYLLIILLGIVIFKKVNVNSMIGGALMATAVFFLISNFGVWMGSSTYPQNFSGLMACYAAGIPFLKGTLLSNLFYCSVLFGTFSLLQRKISFLKLA